MDIENENDDLAMEPSTSEAGKPKMDDEDSDELNDYSNQAKKPRNGMKKRSLEKIQCRICKKMLSSKNRKFSGAQRHASTHPIRFEEKRFPCPVKGCIVRRCWKWSLKEHLENRHPDSLHLLKELELTPEETEEWEQHVQKCFPETVKKDDGSRKNHQSDSPAINESDGYDAQQCDSPTLADMDDEDSDELNDYSNQAKKPRNELENISLEKIRCRMCDKMCTSKNKHFYYAQTHAAYHGSSLGNKETFDCPVDGCGFRHCWMFEVRRHFEKVHKDCELVEDNFKLNDEQWVKWVRHVKECFAEINKKETIKKPAYKKREPMRKRRCNECGDLIVDEKWMLEQHALKIHLTHFTYKCDYPNCKPKLLHRHGLKLHKANKHGIKGAEVKLTDDHKKELAEQLKECFPDY